MCPLGFGKFFLSPFFFSQHSFVLPCLKKPFLVVPKRPDFPVGAFGRFYFGLGAGAGSSGRLPEPLPRSR